MNLFVMIILGVVSREVLLVGGDGERKHFATTSLAELDVGVEEVVQSGEGRAAYVITVTHQQTMQGIRCFQQHSQRRSLA